MPLNILRLNQKGGSAHPNDRVNFIKSLPGPTADTATDFLNRIAAQCAPIMRQHHLSVTTLEEHEPNREFVGRNFNSGEVIQLVLHPLSRRGGGGDVPASSTDGEVDGVRWLPFRYVQMVMMHELAHILQMNHSRDFWKLRNIYANDMRALWDKNYTGDGLWGRGQTLYTGQYNDSQAPDATEVPEHLCGGAYRSRRGKRKRGRCARQQLSYAERKQKRIEKKFGKEGKALGEDELTRYVLESKFGSKPRVAGSKRGRELRAEAAALRMRREENMKKQAEREAEEAKQREYEVMEDDSETEDEFDDALEDAVAEDGSKMLDSMGRTMVKICGEEDASNDAEAENELQELTQIDLGKLRRAVKRPTELSNPSPSKSERLRDVGVAEEDIPTSEDESAEAPKPIDTAPHEFSRVFDFRSTAPNRPLSSAADVVSAEIEPTDSGPPSKPESDTIQRLEEESLARSPNPPSVNPQKCIVCTLDNTLNALTCATCGNVLDTTRLSRHWRCKGDYCRSIGYVNSLDAGLCGLCGDKQPAL